MQLRHLKTLTEIGTEQNSTIIFPMLIDITKSFLEILEKAGNPPGADLLGSPFGALAEGAWPIASDAAV
jgi:hypothetical protein